MQIFGLSLVEFVALIILILGGLFYCYVMRIAVKRPTILSESIKTTEPMYSCPSCGKGYDKPIFDFDIEEVDGRKVVHSIGKCPHCNNPLPNKERVFEEPIDEQTK